MRLLVCLGGNATNSASSCVQLYKIYVLDCLDLVLDCLDMMDI